jgi:hypothetical protein
MGCGLNPGKSAIFVGKSAEIKPVRLSMQCQFQELKGIAFANKPFK